MSCDFGGGYEIIYVSHRHASEAQDLPSVLFRVIFVATDHGSIRRPSLFPNHSAIGLLVEGVPN